MRPSLTWGTRARHSRGVPAPGTHVGYPRTPWAEHTSESAVQSTLATYTLASSMLLYLSPRSFQVGCSRWQCPHLQQGGGKKRAKRGGRGGPAQLLSQPSPTVAGRSDPTLVHTAAEMQPTSPPRLRNLPRVAAAVPPESPGNVLSAVRRPMPFNLAPADLYPPALLPGPPPLLGPAGHISRFLQATYLGRALGVSTPSSDPS